LVESHEFYDIKLLVSDRVFYAHKAILCTRSEYFRILLTSHFKESKQDVITLEELSPATFEIVLKYIYTGIADITTDNVLDIIALGDQLLIQGLMDYSIKELSRSIDKNNASQILSIARDLKSEYLQNRYIQIISKTNNAKPEMIELLNSVDIEVFKERENRVSNKVSEGTVERRERRTRQEIQDPEPLFSSHFLLLGLSLGTIFLLSFFSTQK